MKKSLFGFVTFLLISALAGCGGGGKTAETDRVAGEPKPAVSPGPTVETVDIPFKIGIMTGTVSQGEDEFRAAEMISRKYPGHVEHVTYPDNFMNEQETTISQLTSLAADPEVKVIVASQAVPGSVAALRKIREARPDIKIGFMEPHEDPKVVNAAADISIQPDQVARGRTIIEKARTMGVKTFIHYSFPRHMSQELIARRRDEMKKTAGEMGIDFRFVTAPDPMAEGGLPATQQFVLEDIPREVAQFGTQTAFFSTNCGMMDPMIRQILATGAYFPEQCCPSPTHGYPTALGISIPPEKAGDFAYISEQNRLKIAEAGMSGHFSTWAAPEVIVATRAMVDLLVDSELGKADYKDSGVVAEYLSRTAGVPVTVARYDSTSGNSYLILLDSIYY
ncbi:MAG: DUF3798 domain-containing protein [Candidatus Eisenbacteria bacterium]|nr:DUF3798 domain-containing protein [Candidatus Eisenbacteria bacterium]